MVKILKDRHLEKSDNNVQVFPARLSHINNDELTTHICKSTDPLQESSSFGVDIYNESLHIVQEN